MFFLQSYRDLYIFVPHKIIGLIVNPKHSETILYLLNHPIFTVPATLHGKFNAIKRRVTRHVSGIKKMSIILRESL